MKNILQQFKKLLARNPQVHKGNFGHVLIIGGNYGMGDILSGLVAQNLNLENASITGANIHAYAGDLVAKKQGEIGMIPTDLLNYFPMIINGVKKI